MSLKPERLKRYRDVARLLWRHGRSDVVRSAGLDQALRGEEPAPEEEVAEARELASDLEKMGPTFVKLGQFLSTRPDFLPASYLEGLTRLQDDVKPVPLEEVVAVLESELGLPVAAVFRRFDPEPLAAASLGQVHRATLPDGHAVAVKIQRPGVRDTIGEDLDALHDIAEFLDLHTDVGRRHGFREMIAEFRRSIVAELDYRQEARNLRRIARNLAEFDRILIPLPVDERTTERVLTMDYVRGSKVDRLTVVSRVDADGVELAEQLFRAYLQQILVDGFFHADPHPGNVFVTDDGRLALIDLGMAATVSPDLQERLLRWLLAVTEGRGEDAAQIAVEIGKRREDFRESEFRTRIADLVARHGQPGRLEDMQVGRLVLEGATLAGECGIWVPRELVMLGKALLNLDQVGRVLDPQFDPNASIRRNAAEILRRRLLKELSPSHLFAGFLEMKGFAARLPQRVARVLDNLAENRLELKVDAVDEERLIQGLHKIANRICVGLILAALIVAAAMLARVPTRFEILGYPGVAMLLFLAAATGGSALVVGILLHDRRPDRRA